MPLLYGGILPDLCQPVKHMSRAAILPPKGTRGVADTEARELCFVKYQRIIQNDSCMNKYFSKNPKNSWAVPGENNFLHDSASAING